MSEQIEPIPVADLSLRQRADFRFPALQKPTVVVTNDEVISRIESSGELFHQRLAEIFRVPDQDISNIGFIVSPINERHPEVRVVRLLCHLDQYVFAFDTGISLQAPSLMAKPEDGLVVDSGPRAIDQPVSLLSDTAVRRSDQFGLPLEDDIRVFDDFVHAVLRLDANDAVSDLRRLVATSSPDTIFSRLELGDIVLRWAAEGFEALPASAGLFH